MSIADDYDGPWKEALEAYLPETLAFFFPQAYRGIDWARGYEWMDKELQQVAPDHERGSQTVDKLVGVWALDGTPTWLLLHLEVQSQYVANFEQRMFRYHTRLYDRFLVDVVSLAILGDEGRTWRPHRFEYARWGCAVGLTFPSVKLIEYDLTALEASANPCALVVLAHRTAQATRRDPNGRAAAKVRLARLLFARGYDRATIERLYRFIDWLLRLPKDLEETVWQQVQAIEEEQRMVYLTYPERRGLEEGLAKGRVEGLQEGIALVLKNRFSASSGPLLAEIQPLTDPAILGSIMERALTAATLDEVRAVFTSTE